VWENSVCQDLGNAIRTFAVSPVDKVQVTQQFKRPRVRAVDGKRGHAVPEGDVGWGFLSFGEFVVVRLCLLELVALKRALNQRASRGAQLQHQPFVVAQPTSVVMRIGVLEPQTQHHKRLFVKRKVEAQQGGFDVRGWAD
jgi:hypothetical protein